MAMSVVYTTVNGQVLSENRGGVVHHFIPDPLGSVVMVRDTAGNTVYEAEYAPYGDVQSETGTNPSEFGYVGTLGYVKDSASSLYVRARYLLTNLGRWLTKDPLWPEEAGYVYAGARPTKWSDPVGLRPSFGKPVGILPLDYHGKYCGALVGILANADGVLAFYDRPFFGKGDTCMRNWPAPGSCLDDACLTHDLCLSAPRAMVGYDARVCHCNALSSAVDCLLTGGGPDPITLITFIATFTLLCAVPDKVGSGFIGIEAACRRCRTQAMMACMRSPEPVLCFYRYRRMYCKRIFRSC